MGVRAVTKDVTTDLNITLVDASADPVNGLTSGDVTVEYRKNGAAGFTTKVLLAGEFNEVGDGVYLVTFTLGELDTAGSFRFKVSGGTFETAVQDVLVIDEQLSINQQIVDIKAGMAKLVTSRDADILFAQVEQRKQDTEKRIKDAEKRIKILKGQLAALRANS